MKNALLILGIIALAGVGYAKYYRPTEETEAPVYQMIPVANRDIVVSASAAGEIEPIKTVEVKSKASGAIFEMRVETGDEVTAGELLLRVDPRVPRNNLRQAQADLQLAQAQLENAESRLKRSEELHQTQSITDQEWEDAKLAVANANAGLVRAQRQLEDAKISYEDTDVKSPIDGMVIQKNVEEGTVISSATGNVSGGAVLLLLANLDTVQVRAMVDETDIGKIHPDLEVTIGVDAYPNRPFQGKVLKVEPQATVEQNVTMFPVLVRIPNDGGLLRPGMNTEVDVHIGRREGVVAVPNAALRTERDIASAAEVLGLDINDVRAKIAAARNGTRPGGEASLAGRATEKPASDEHSITTPDGREITLPEGVTVKQATALFAKLRGGGGFQSLSSQDRALLRKMRANRGGRGGGRRENQHSSGTDANLFGGNYIVFALRNGVPTPAPIRTGLTDLDYSEVMSGLAVGDTVLVLPSASLLASQQQLAERINRIRGRGLPGVQRR
ncbi:MAG: efflux RND transporter periplasmic adaptor subunit [Gemmatimonadales bacterium]